MASTIPVIVQGNSFSLAIPLQIYYINGDQMDLQDYAPDPTDEVSVQLKGSRRNYTYTPTIDGNVANIDLSGNELADNYSVVVSIVKANGQRLRSFRTDQFFIVESSDDLTQDDIIAGLEENVIYLNAQAFIAGADGRGIQSILKTGTSGLVDTYTITYTDNTTSTFQVTNGANGQAGAQGVGITSIEKTGTSGLVDTYTITLSNGQTSTFEVTNGQDGHDLGLASIINNLKSDSTEDALSAAMGKELGDKLWPTVSNDISTSSLTKQNCSLGASKKWTSTSGAKHIAIPIVQGAKYKIKVASTQTDGGFYGFVTSAYNPPYSSGQTTPYVTNGNRNWLYVSDPEMTLMPPSDAAWLICCVVDGSGKSSTWTVKEETKSDAIEDINNELKDSKVHPIKEVSVNLSDYTEVRAFPNPSVWLVTDAQYPYKGKFIALPNGVSKINIQGNDDAITYYAFLTTSIFANNQSVSYATGASRVSLDAGKNSGDVAVPSDARSLWICTYITTDCTPQSVKLFYDLASVDLVKGLNYTMLSWEQNIYVDAVESSATFGQALSASSAYVTSEYTTCNGFSVLRTGLVVMKSSMATYRNAGLVFYDDNKVAIKGYNYAESNYGAKTIEVEIPLNAKYFRVTWWNGEDSYRATLAYDFLGVNEKIEQIKSCLEIPDPYKAITGTYRGEKILLNEHPFGIEEYMDAPWGDTTQTRQGAACYGDTLFTFHNQNAKIEVYNMRTKQRTQVITPTGGTAHIHCNTANFSTKFYDASDPFPLLYITSVGNEVWRITGTEGNYQMTLIQTISDDGDLYIGQDGTLWKIGWGGGASSSSPADGGYMTFTQYKVPSIDAVLPTLDSSLAIKEVHAVQQIPVQGAFIKNNKLYFCFGYASSTSPNYGRGVGVIDLDSGATLTIINLGKYGFTYEPQGLFEWNGALYMTAGANQNNTTKVYRLYT